MSVRLLVLLVVIKSVCGSHDGMDYLQSAITDLKNMNQISISRSRRVDTLQALPVQREEVKALHEPVPTLGLTKGELAELYESAINRGKTVKFDTGNGNLVHAAVHEIDAPQDEDHQGSADDSGYYYYYYPLKSFVDEISSQSNDQYLESDQHLHYEADPHKNHDHQSHYHSHTHKHTVIMPVKPDKNWEDKSHLSLKQSKALEPLFMAISGFIGMAVMFVVSVLVLPKFGILKSRGGKQQFGSESYSVTGIVLRAIEGKQCSEKLACEIGKTANAYNMYNNRFVKFLRRFAPALIAKQIEKVGKYTDKKYKCAAIQCKRKNNVPSKPKPAKKQNKA